jgi:hypothetical protein
MNDVRRGIGPVTISVIQSKRIGLPALEAAG